MIDANSMLDQFDAQDARIRELEAQRDDARCEGQTMTKSDEYQEALACAKEMGYNSLREYVEAMAEEHGVPLETARWLYSMLGHREAFDGLVNALEDYAESRME